MSEGDPVALNQNNKATDGAVERGKKQGSQRNKGGCAVPAVGAVDKDVLALNDNQPAERLGRGEDAGEMQVPAGGEDGGLEIFPHLWLALWIQRSAAHISQFCEAVSHCMDIPYAKELKRSIRHLLCFLKSPTQKRVAKGCNEGAGISDVQADRGRF